MEDRIVELLGAGAPQHVVAEAVGVDPSYISQLMQREEVAARVAELRLKKASEHVAHDSNITDLEKTALEKMAHLLPLQTDLMKVTRVFQVLNAAKKASDAALAQQASTPGTIVTLNFSAEAQVELKMTSNKEIVEINGRSMVPMPSHMVAQKLRDKKAAMLLAHSTPVLSVPMISNKTKSIVDQL